MTRGSWQAKRSNREIDHQACGRYNSAMSTTAEKIVAEALALSPQARAFVAERLLESLDADPGDEISPAWREEIRRRCREIEEGAVELREAADVSAKAYQSLE